MGVLNTNPNFVEMFNRLSNRIRFLEQSKRFTAPYVTANPAYPNNGDLWVRSDQSRLYSEVNGVAVPMSPAVIGYAQITANQTGIPNTQTDVTGLSTTVSLVVGRRYRITTRIGFAVGATATGASVYITDSANTQVAFQYQNLYGTALENMFAPSTVFVAGATGSGTYKIRATASAGTITAIASSANVGYIMVEDLGT